MTFDDVEPVATSLPGVEEGTSYGNRCWKVGGSAFATRRPLARRLVGDERLLGHEVLDRHEHLLARDGS